MPTKYFQKEERCFSLSRDRNEGLRAAVMMTLMMNLADLRSVWNISPILSLRTPETGTIHTTTLLSTTKGSYALRAYRYQNEERWRIESEHAVIKYVRERGLPAIAPLPLSTGGTIFEHEGSFYALFPCARGQQVQRSLLAMNQNLVTTMGEFLAWLHHALRDYPQERVPSPPFSVDHATTLARIEEIEMVIRSQPHLDEGDRQALRRLEQRQAWLTTTSPVDVASLMSLEHQVIHGDYQETNVFFEDDTVSAIIDWDWTYPAPRAWEVIRALHYLFRFEVAQSRAFLQAYRRVLPLPLADLEVAAHVYAWIREHDLWLFEELYLRGNQRVRVFVRPGNFTPLAQRWAPLQRTLE